MGAAREATNLKMQRDKQFSYEFSGHIPPHSKNEGSHADIEAKPFADQKVDHYHDTCCTEGPQCSIILIHEQITYLIKIPTDVSPTTIFSRLQLTQ